MRFDIGRIDTRKMTKPRLLGPVYQELGRIARQEIAIPRKPNPKPGLRLISGPRQMTIENGQVQPALQFPE